MINLVLDLLSIDDYVGESDTIDIAKGKLRV